MRTPRIIIAFTLVTTFIAGLGVLPARAARVDCAQVRNVLEEGKPIGEVPEILGTTRARVEACARIAEAQARHASRRESLRQQRAARRLQKTP